LGSSDWQVIGTEDRLRNDLYCVGWGVKLYSIQSSCHILQYFTLKTLLSSQALKVYMSTNYFFDTYVARIVPVSTNCSVIDVVNRLLFFSALTEKQ